MININYTLLIQLANFLILMVILNFLLFRPILRVLDERERLVKESTEIKERLKELLPRKAGIEYEYGQRFGRHGHFRGIQVELIGLD